MIEKQLTHKNEKSNGIVAHSADWKSVTTQLILTEAPQKNQVYNLQFQTPLKSCLQKKFWCVYMSPNAQLNGFDCEADIASLCFCNVTILDTDMGNKSRQQQVRTNEIIKINNIDSHISLHTSIKLEWLQLLEKFSTSKRYYHTQNYTYFSLIEINIQSNMGMDFIIQKSASETRIVAVNDWGPPYGKDNWYATNKILTKSEKQQYGI